MNREYDISVKQISPLKNGRYLSTKHTHEGRDDNRLVKKINKMPSHLGACTLSHSKRLIKKVIAQIDGFYSKNKYYTDTDSIHKQKREWNKLEDSGFIQDGLGFCKNDYGDDAILKVLFLGP